MNRASLLPSSPLAERFQALLRCVDRCNLCPRMAERKRVLSEANGSVRSRVLFIAEAPGRLGADRTGIPLYGDKAGANFEVLLANVGWSRSDVFITNAILCNPRSETGTNGVPTEEEVRHCSIFLAMTIEVIDPEVIVTLGATALRSLAYIQGHRYKLNTHLAQLVPWNGRLVMPLYHPSQRAVTHRSLAAQRGDFFRLSKIVHPAHGLVSRVKAPRPAAASQASARLAEVISFLVSRTGPISKFKLTKLLFFSDLLWVSSRGVGVTGAVYLRQVDGPWPPKLDSALQALLGRDILIAQSGRGTVVVPGPSPKNDYDLSEEEMRLLAHTAQKYAGFNNSQIKVAAYRSKPMQSILAAERRGESTNNRLVLDASRPRPDAPS